MLKQCTTKHEYLAWKLMETGGLDYEFDEVMTPLKIRMRSHYVLTPLNVPYLVYMCQGNFHT